MDWNRVAKWHGHTSVHETMETYAPAVEVHQQMYGDDWISRAFGRPHRP
jgi:hypothetical protein